AGRARADGRQFLLAVPRRVRRAAVDARPDRARLAGGVAGGGAEEGAARIPTLDAWRADGRWRVEYPNPARRCRGHARRGAGAGGRFRRRLSLGLWRRLLRPNAGEPVAASVRDCFGLRIPEARDDLSAVLRS